MPSISVLSGRARAAFGRLKAAATNVAAASPALEKLTGLNAALLNREVQELTPLARGMLVSNWNGSGLHSRTGQLRQSLFRAKAKLGRAGIVVEYAAGLKRADDKRAQAAYVIASSLQYGAVRSGPVLRGKKRAKKAVKQAALRRIGTAKSIEVGAGGVRVTRPRPFFFLTPAQKERMVQELSKRLQAALKAS